MKLWRINYEGGDSNTAKGVADIWTGTPGVSSVDDLGAEPTPTPPAVPSLDMGGFIKLGYQIDAAGVDAALVAMPSLQLLLMQHKDSKTLTYADATTEGTSLYTALDRIVAGGHFTSQQRADFLALWAAL